MKYIFYLKISILAAHKHFYLMTCINTHILYIILQWKWMDKIWIWRNTRDVNIPGGIYSVRLQQHRQPHQIQLHSMGSSKCYWSCNIQSDCWATNSGVLWRIHWYRIHVSQDWPSSCARFFCWSNGKLGTYYIQVSTNNILYLKS